MSARLPLQESSSRWFCPVHADEFWVPHGGKCPAPSCEEALVAFVPRAVAEALAEAIERFELTGSPLCLWETLARHRAIYPKAEEESNGR